MSEYLPGLTVLGKVDLESNNISERPKGLHVEKYLKDLEMSLMTMAGRLSSEYGNLFNAAGQITMDGPEAEKDRFRVLKKEEKFASDQGKDLQSWRLDREKNPSGVTEVCLTLLFDKILRNDFVIVRASDFDDYIHGADMLIIDKNTGAVICGIDDVLGHLGDDGGKKKKEVIKSIMKSGGAEIKYGATIKENKLIRQSLNNVPLFYFSITKEELGDLLESLKGGRREVSDKEKNIFFKLANSLSQQFDEISGNHELDKNLRLNLTKLEPSLKKILKS